MKTAYQPIEFETPIGLMKATVEIDYDVHLEGPSREDDKNVYANARVMVYHTRIRIRETEPDG